MPNYHQLALVAIWSNITVFFGQEYGVEGKVLHEGTTEPIAYATAALYTQIDSALVNGVLSDDTGHFSIKAPGPGLYYIKISMLGFGEHIVPNIILDNSKPHIDTGTLYVRPESIALDGVEVVSERAAVEYKVDRKVIDITKLGVANNVQLSEALRILPSIDADAQGNVSLRGSRNFQVLIDGKPSPLRGSEALQQYTAAEIERVELITNPSAKYRAGNTSGIINLILKKGEGLGFSGLVNYGFNRGIGEYQPYNFNTTLSYKRKKYSLTSTVSFRDQRYEFNMIGNLRRANQVDMQNLFRNPVPWTRSRISLDFDYSPNERHTITLAGRYIQRDNQFDIQTQHLFLEPNSVPFFSRVKGITKRHTYALSLYDLLKFEDEGHELKSLLTYFDQPIEERQFFKEYESLQQENLSADSFQNVLSDHHQINLTVDYSKPIHESAKWEAGIDILGISRTSTRETETFLPEPSPFALDRFTVKTSTYAGYGTFMDQLSNLDFQVGLRAEYYTRLIEQLGSDISYDFRRLNLFPNVHILKKIKDKREFKLSYSRRIRRPSMFRLQPYLNWSNNFISYGGNPNLIPALISSFELSHIHRFKKVTAVLEGFYRITLNEIANGQRLNTETGILEGGPVNIDNSKFYGVETSLDIKPTPWLQTIASGTYFRNTISGTLFDQEIDQRFYAWRGRLNNRVDLGKKIQLNLNAFYNSKIKTVQGEQASNYWINISLSTPILGDKGTFSISYRDVFGTGRYYETTRGVDFTDEGRLRQPRQVLGFDLSYRFNSYKKKEKQFEFED
ncbi:outer membrane beta-barrel family protein [Ulvibacterium marinum]|uniref:outer membrane beta-barrel family protein n=1 Tax=Ulvibacterium marinum TaxID=2419782 RepID=UPI002494CA94|nr:outer membrane beta-barrel family protein [Ulvibacterium marinum]